MYLLIKLLSRLISP